MKILNSKRVRLNLLVHLQHNYIDTIVNKFVPTLSKGIIGDILCATFVPIFHLPLATSVYPNV